jgi:hypothetical protein
MPPSFFYKSSEEEIETDKALKIESRTLKLIKLIDER